MTKIFSLPKGRALCYTLILGSMIGFTSCNSEEPIIEEPKDEIVEIEEGKYLPEFSTILSKAVYAKLELRKFLKEEALKQFDCNYDVLYQLVKEDDINGMSFRDLLLQYTTEEKLSEIEYHNPMLTIRIPEIAFLDVHPEKLDVLDNELPVIFMTDDGNDMYLNGEKIQTLKKGEIPDFNVLIVTQNKRVAEILPSRIGRPNVTFKHECYDGSRYNTAQGSRTATVSSLIPGAKAVQAFNYFYADDNTIHSRALQRDYIYYGLTPDNEKGYLNYGVSEYLSFIEIDPKAYFQIGDVALGDASEDPRIVKEKVTRKKKDFTEEELLDRFWSEGSYDIKIQVATSSNTWPMEYHLLLKPGEIWDCHFELHRTHRNKTALRHSRYTYHIDPNDFTSIRYYIPLEKKISLGKWDLSTEAATRYVVFSEVDNGTQVTETYKYEMIKASSAKVNGSFKFGLGLSEVGPNGQVSVEGNASNTEHETKEVKIVRTDNDDQLGSVRIYFYDPIIESRNGSGYNVRTYNTGIVMFGLSAE